MICRIISTVSQWAGHLKQALEQEMRMYSRKDAIVDRRFTHLQTVACGIMTALVMSGCMTAKLSGLERASDPIKEEIYHGNGWCRGRSWCSAWDDEKSCDRTLGSVQVKYNYLHALAAVLSFGTYMPVEIDHRLNPKGVEGTVKK